MNVIVMLFGPQALLVGARELSVACAGPRLTIAELRRTMATTEPRLAPTLPSSRFALNLEFVNDDAVVQESDEVALIGMVAGG